MVVMKNDQPPSKMSMGTHFRGWWIGGCEKQLTTLENERARSFSRVVECAICKSLNWCNIV